MAAEDLEITKDGPTVTPWRVRITQGPSIGALVAYGFRTKRAAQERLDEVAHLPWGQLRQTTDTDDPIVTVPTQIMRDMAADLAKAHRELAAYRLVALHIDLHSDVTQEALRHAMDRAKANPDRDPWETTDGPS